MINTIKRLQGLSRHFSTSKLRYKFKHREAMIPHPSKAAKGGEDAIFVDDNLLVVADGVGGWAQYGVDPGIFSRKLCKLIGQIYAKDKESYYENPHLLIPKAVSLNRQTGTSTICLVSLHPQTGKLSSSYIGDSVYSVYRKTDKYNLLYQAEEHQRQFNFPYQVGTDGDDPKVSLTNSMQSEVNDIVVIASDGLWDNLDLPAMKKIVNESEAERIAQLLAETAYTKSLSFDYESPFSTKAKKSGLHYPRSGKPDDISVISAQVVKE